MESLNAQAASVQYKIDESSIHAPVQGIVAGLDVQEGMVVVPGQRIMTIVPRGEYLIKVYVLTEDAAKIKPGMEVELVLDNKEKEIVFPGRVEELAPSAIEKTSALGLIEQRIKVTVRAAFPPELDLRPGYALDVHFTTQKQLNKLVVPKTAVFPYEGGDAVWVARENRARIQPVSLGLENDREVAIEEGLQPGELIILNPQLEGLAAGKKIRN